MNSTTGRAKSGAGPKLRGRDRVLESRETGTAPPRISGELVANPVSSRYTGQRRLVSKAFPHIGRQTAMPPEPSN